MYKKIYSNPDIYSIHVPLPNNPLKNLNCYVVKTPEKNLIIDTGFNMPECYESLKESLEKLEIDIDKTDMFLTHLHADHTGLVTNIMNKDSTIYMSKIDYEYLLSADDSYFKEMYDYYVLEGFPRDEIEVLTDTNPSKAYGPESSFNAITFDDGFKFKIGDYEFTCILTPGHTPGHACLYIEKEKIMFLGDHILFDITPNISHWRGVENPLGDYLKSLLKIKAFEIKTALPAHRGNDMDVYKRIDQLLEHHQVRLKEVLEIIKEESGLNSYEIASNMKWSMKGKSWREAPIYQKWFATSEALAHLEYLIEENKVYKRLEDGIYRYYCHG